ncbi:hypothetical protein AVEN_179654-1 [Araneus ventricosus]|uniref:Uncharacterized protein n=1 Tax=Araneus ventricosus TaxID=182803 RepID=A0A4Y2W7C2_ARAVE|nr:hypothetical protein AVEN_179654-1 [Araneus ventricosus]
MSFLFATFSNILTVKLQGLNLLLGHSGSSSLAVEKLPVVDYEPIDCSITDIDRNLLSIGHQYLSDISNAITWEIVQKTWQIGTLVLCSIPDG